MNQLEHYREKLAIARRQAAEINERVSKQLDAKQQEIDELETLVADMEKANAPLTHKTPKKPRHPHSATSSTSSIDEENGAPAD